MALNDWYDEQKKIKAGQQATNQGSGELFGVNISDPGYGGARAATLSGIAETLKPSYQSAMGQYKQRGFGRIFAPAVQQAMFQPIHQAGAEAARRSMADLYFRQEELGMKKKAHKEMMTQQKEKRRGGKVICTLLWNKGILPFSHIKADYKYLDMLFETEEGKKIHEDYLRWGTKLVKFMANNDWAVWIAAPLVRAWSGYMKAIVENKPIPLSGLIVHRLGILIGKIYRVIGG